MFWVVKRRKGCYTEEEGGGTEERRAIVQKGEFNCLSFFPDPDDNQKLYGCKQHLLYNCRFYSFET